MLVPEVQITTKMLENEAAKAPSQQWTQLQKLSTISFFYANLFREKLHALAITPKASSPADQALRSTLLQSRTLLGPFDLQMMDSAVIWLDHGIRKVVIQADGLEEHQLQQAAEAISQLPPTRVLLRIPIELSSLLDHEVRDLPPHADMNTIKSIQHKLHKLSTVCSGFVLALKSSSSHLNPVNPLHQEEFNALSTALQSIRQDLDETCWLTVEWTAAKQESFDRSIMVHRIGDLHRHGIHLLAPARVQMKEAEEVDRMRFIDAAKAFVACLRSDRPDGLFTTVVTDDAGVALGLVYSSAESIVLAIESGRGVYYSRSRKGLWKKGESSGNVQRLVQLDLDCDSDALRVMVHQDGSGFCHLNTRACWGEATGVRALEAMLQSRLSEAPAGSYTKRLFQDPELLRNKLVEEAQELAEATDVTHVAEEAADVLYFAMVRCVAAGATLSDVEKQLDKRSLKVKRRPGNAKAYRIDAAQEILNKKRQKKD